MRFEFLSLVTVMFLAGATAQNPPGAGVGGPGNDLIRQGSQLDLEGKGEDARRVFERAISQAANPAAKAAAQRAMAMSWAFEGDCKKAAEYEEMVIAYWKTQEQAAPENAFYQQGEMANEAARVCIDHGDVENAARLYKRGYDLGIREPDISSGRKALWEYRWQNAQARIAARKGDKAGAAPHVAAAAEALSVMEKSDPRLYRQQRVFQPYLVGYVALYTGDYPAAVASLKQANQNDASIQCLLGMAYEKLGDTAQAQQAYELAGAVTSHNPPAAFAKPFTRARLAQTVKE